MQAMPYTADETARRASLTQRQYPPLLIPGTVRHIKALPLLGSEKPDYVSLKQLAESERE